MRVSGRRWLRNAWRPLMGALALGSSLMGCDKATDPAPVALDELKFAFGLKAVDQGNGTVRLKWSGVNNEEDFSGYNIYGVKNNTSVADLEGKAIKLLDDKGEVDAEGKKTLGQMGYNGKDWETPGPAENPDGDFAVYPYHKKPATEGDVILPSCLPAGGTPGTDGYECKTLAAEGSKGTFNGQAYFDITDLSMGAKYCFTILATLDDGKKAAPATSEVRCIVPRSSVAATGLTGVAQKYLALDLKTLRTNCSSKGGAQCGALPTEIIDDISAADKKNCNIEKTACLEYFGAIPRLYITASSLSAVQDLGYYAKGLSDPTLPRIPTLTKKLSIQNVDGYSIQGQSIPLEKDHIYVIVEKESAAATSGFFYHLVHATSVNHSAATANVEIRVAAKADTP